MVDFNQHDDLERWVLANLKLSIKIGKLKYYRCRTMANWHASLAKNTVHMAACRDVGDGVTSSKAWAILVNLDGDNIFSPTWLRKLLTDKDHGLQLGQGLANVIHYQNPEDSGTYGRLAYMSTAFEQAQGYDVSFLPVGCQDTDLLNRLGAGENTLSFKARYVGVSIPNAPTTGKTKDDSDASNKAPTACHALSQVCTTQFMHILYTLHTYVLLVGF